MCIRDSNIVIDTTPDFRFQAMREKLDRLDAVLYTHGHADHILGLDAIRPYNLKQRSLVPLYSSMETQATLRKQFAYIFDDAPTVSSMPGVEMHSIDGPFELFGLKIIPVPANHGPTSVLGFRFGKAAYLTDFSSVPESSKDLLRGLDDFRKAPWTTKLLGEDVKTRYADLKQASADRCPRQLGTFVKAPEVQFHHEVYNQFLWNLF